jgi:hypothetical protein
LDKNHIAGHEASGVCAASRIGFTVEDNRAVTVGGVSEDLMEKDCESVQVTNVERAEIRMESIVEKGIVNSEVDGRSALGRRGSGLCPSSTLAGRLGLFERIREWSARGRSRIIRSQVEAICVCLLLDPKHWSDCGTAAAGPCDARTLDVLNHLARVASVNGHDGGFLKSAELVKW